MHVENLLNSNTHTFNLLVLLLSNARPIFDALLLLFLMTYFGLDTYLPKLSSRYEGLFHSYCHRFKLVYRPFRHGNVSLSSIYGRNIIIIVFICGVGTGNIPLFALAYRFGKHSSSRMCDARYLFILRCTQNELFHVRSSFYGCRTIMRGVWWKNKEFMQTPICSD